MNSMALVHDRAKGQLNKAKDVTEKPSELVMILCPRQVQSARKRSLEAANRSGKNAA